MPATRKFTEKRLKRRKRNKYALVKQPKLRYTGKCTGSQKIKKPCEKAYCLQRMTSPNDQQKPENSALCF